MKAEHVATYLTRTGILALQISRITNNRGGVYYNYTGKHGAGSGHPLPHVRKTVALMLQCHRGVRLSEGEDILAAGPVSQPLDLRPHPGG